MSDKNLKMDSCACSSGGSVSTWTCAASSTSLRASNSFMTEGKSENSSDSKREHPTSRTRGASYEDARVFVASSANGVDAFSAMPVTPVTPPDSTKSVSRSHGVSERGIALTRMLQ